MLFQKRYWPGLADGTITLAFRRWKRPTVKQGGTLRSPGGMLAIDEVERVALRSITVEHARESGFETKAELLRELEGRSGTLYRIRFHPGGPDPRVALRDRASLGEDEWSALDVALRRSDERSVSGPWTRATLQLIADNPERRAGDLAPRMSMELKEFKTKVRRLKALGLTESRKVGYRLSPRGAAFVSRTPSDG